MLLNTSLIKSKLAKRLVLYILIFSSIVTLVLTILQLHRDYNYDLSLIDIRFNEIKATNKAVLEKNYWLLNHQSISLLLDGLLRHQDIVYLEVTNEKGKVILTKGAIPQGSFREEIIPLNYTYRDVTHPLGNLKVVATLEYVYQRLIDTALIILVTQAIKTFLVSIFIVFVAWKLITRHLEVISKYAGKLELGDRPKKIILNRKESYWTQDDDLDKVINSLNIMHQKLHASYSELEHQSLHDHLTGLPNRRLLEDRLQHELLQNERMQKYGVLLFIDLDHFKLLNDSLGHTIGDKLLCEIAKRLKSVVRQGDTVARVGGDEFIILLSMLSDRSSDAILEAKMIGNKTLEKLNKQFHLEGHNYHITASIGITVFKGGHDDSESILKHVDNAMYQAKADGRNTLCVYQSEMQEAADNRLSIEQKLHDALINNEFILHYQPKYDRQRKIVSAEVLVRWQPPHGEIILPSKFINIAEESGLIVPIGAQILKLVFQQSVAEIEIMKQAGLHNIAINISPRQFNDPDFIELIESEISSSKLDSEFFIFEITEEAVVKNVKKTIEVMSVLKRHGFKLSIDDFGTGYSSLRYLKDFPLDELKIDQSFINNIVKNKKDAAIVSSIISMAKNLGLNVVAEGVETEDQFEILINNDCQMFQGYLFSKPIEHKAFIELLMQHA